MDDGLYPYSQRYLGTLRNHFSTLGVNGLNEMVRNLSDDRFDIADPEGQQLAIEVLEHVRERLSSAEACKSLVRTALSRFRLPYLTVTPTFSICPVHGYLAGEHEFCPKCDEALLAQHASPTDATA